MCGIKKSLEKLGAVQIGTHSRDAIYSSKPFDNDNIIDPVDQPFRSPSLYGVIMVPRAIFARSF